MKLIHFFFGFVYLVFIAHITSCQPERSVKLGSSTNLSAAKAAEPRFKDQGDLFFLRKDDTISTIDIEIAETEPTRNRGLMYRSEMAESYGMLFIYEEEKKQRFWMQNTFIPLDLLFIDSQNNIIQISANQPAYNTVGIPCAIPTQYVLEVNSGYCQKHGIRNGDRVVWVK